MNFQPRGKQTDVMALEHNKNQVVLGCAGSGKSVCAILRTEYLNALGYPAMILTYNNRLRDYIDQISNHKVETNTVVTFMLDIIKQSTGNFEIKLLSSPDSTIRKALKEVQKKYPNLSFLSNEAFILDEIRWLQRMGVVDEQIYYNAERIGRSTTRVRRENRQYVFEVFEKYLTLREKQHFACDANDIGLLFQQLLQEGTIKKDHIHLVIDEGQDLAPSILKALVDYVSFGGSITYFGDSAQQIYGNRFSWKNVGMNHNKTLVLDENYRNSTKIFKVCNALREVITLDEEETKKAIDLVHEKTGDPMLIECEDSESEIESIYQIIMRHQLTGNIAILVPMNWMCQKIADYLKEKGIVVGLLKNIKSFDQPIVIGTYHSAKGLEFDSVILPFCTDEHIKKLIKSDVEEEIQNGIRKFLYVAVSRAKDGLLITASPQAANMIQNIKHLFHCKEGYYV